MRVGIVGLGAAGRAFIPALRAHAQVELVSAADVADEARAEFTQTHGLPAYATLDAMLAQESLDAVYVATPTELHRAHVEQACGAGKSVLVEKPMAATLDDARAMVAAADAAGVALVVGHSHGHDLPIRRMREIVESGELGAVRMVNTWCWSDWMYRPRRREELDVAQGGGVTFRQGSHQFDIVRLLCGGLARSVRATTFDWDPERRTIGAHIAFIAFANGAAATAVYNGYGHFSTAELCFDIGEWGFPAPRGVAHRPRAGASAEAELRAKRERARNAIPAHAPHQPFFGLTIVSCERGDIRQSPDGLLVYSHEGCREIALPNDRSPRDLVVEEWHDAFAGRARAVHDGRFGLANLEVCVAAMASSQSAREVLLHEQVAVI